MSSESTTINGMARFAQVSRPDSVAMHGERISRSRGSAIPQSSRLGGKKWRFPTRAAKAEFREFRTQLGSDCELTDNRQKDSVSCRFAVELQQVRHGRRLPFRSTESPWIENLERRSVGFLHFLVCPSVPRPPHPPPVRCSPPRLQTQSE
jgi:hypothetical protein